ncbi:hypothetical protein [Paenibacillus radicis (ex Xue et al. 2023)]|uniref:Uncharacterized protein n=1 Tax=Paenibacillus radicis (ex Xue et al. 2023) TaxID=2972489 RepID=A0ABT1YFP4_9BACL|nr:hypothetical protein [Paenibacillus radicis (ex Xue et al. 2023)]MCR8632017.1 hypothetical protein [Paenibacillus radicis (ex Xue et al. 2023)]
MNKMEKKLSGDQVSSQRTRFSFSSCRSCSNGKREPISLSNSAFD